MLLSLLKSILLSKERKLRESGCNNEWNLVEMAMFKTPLMKSWILSLPLVLQSQQNRVLNNNYMWNTHTQQILNFAYAIKSQKNLLHWHKFSIFNTKGFTFRLCPLLAVVWLSHLSYPCLTECIYGLFDSLWEFCSVAILQKSFSIHPCKHSLQFI